MFLGQTNVEEEAEAPTPAQSAKAQLHHKNDSVRFIIRFSSMNSPGIQVCYGKYIILAYSCIPDHIASYVLQFQIIIMVTRQFNFFNLDNKLWKLKSLSFLYQDIA